MSKEGSDPGGAMDRRMWSSQQMRDPRNMVRSGALRGSSVDGLLMLILKPELSWRERQ